MSKPQTSRSRGAMELAGDSLTTELRTIAKLEGVSQRTLAGELGLSRSTLQESLRDGSHLDESFGRARAIAQACGWDLCIVARPLGETLLDPLG